MIVVAVPLATRPYDVVVGSGAVAELPRLVPDGARRAAVVTQAGIPVEVDPGIEFETFAIEDGEAAKTLTTVEDLARRFARWGLTRADVVLGVGGGVVTDVAGFCAATYHRGVPVVHVSTTLLGQVDAAIGGKTGVNLPEGKNLVGAFWQPVGVICDTDHLDTLPERELQSGLGEVAKYHFLARPDERLEGLSLEEQIAQCVRIKARVVADDERERVGHTAGRAVLNYGHTLAHALETAGGYGLRHGECVAVGLVYAAAVAHRLGRIDDSRLTHHRSVVEGLGLGHRLPPDADPDALMHLFARDKKAVDGITLVLDGPRGVEQVSGIEPEVLRHAFEELI